MTSNEKLSIAPGRLGLRPTPETEDEYVEEMLEEPFTDPVNTRRTLPGVLTGLGVLLQL